MSGGLVVGSANVDHVVRAGRLPPPDAAVSAALASNFGDGAARWHERLRQVVPAPFLDTVAAAAIPDVAAELLYVCSAPRRP